MQRKGGVRCDNEDNQNRGRRDETAAGSRTEGTRWGFFTMKLFEVEGMIANSQPNRKKYANDKHS